MKIMRAIFAFIIYGILASFIVYDIEKYIPFITLKYNIIYFILIASFITAFTFLLENSKTKKMGYIFLVFFLHHILPIFSTSCLMQLHSLIWKVSHLEWIIH